MAFLATTAKEIEAGVIDEDGYTKTHYTVERLHEIQGGSGVPGSRCKVTTYTEARQ